jgi:hypothetical protein
MKELQELLVFFEKYKFPAATKARCYEKLINTRNNIDILRGEKIIEADSLFNV